MEFLGNIGIDPKLVIAQVVNFLVLVFILRLLVYKPLIAIFKKRQELTRKLEADLAQVEKKKNEADAAYRAKLLDADGRANEILRQAKKTTETFEEGAREKNREYLDQMLRETQERIEGAKSELEKLNTETVRAEAFDLASSFLSDRLKRELHEKLVTDALHDFEELGSREEDIAFKGPVSVLAAFPLSQSFKSHLKRLLDKKFGKKVSYAIDTEEGLRAGLIIRWGGYELDGSLRGSLPRCRRFEVLDSSTFVCL